MDEYDLISRNLKRNDLRTNISLENFEIGTSISTVTPVFDYLYYLCDN